jgi:hypothetical protein
MAELYLYSKVCISIDPLMSFDYIGSEYRHQMIIIKSYNN